MAAANKSGPSNTGPGSLLPGSESGQSNPGPGSLLPGGGSGQSNPGPGSLLPGSGSGPSNPGPGSLLPGGGSGPSGPGQGSLPPAGHPITHSCGPWPRTGSHKLFAHKDVYTSEERGNILVTLVNMRRWGCIKGWRGRVALRDGGDGGGWFVPISKEVKYIVIIIHRRVEIVYMNTAAVASWHKALNSYPCLCMVTVTMVTVTMVTCSHYANCHYGNCPTLLLSHTLTVLCCLIPSRYHVIQDFYFKVMAK